MQLLVIILNDTDKRDQVVTALIEAGVPGGTVIESQGMGQIVSSGIPIFAGFRHLMEGAKPFNYTIMSVVPNEQVVQEALMIVNDVLDIGDKHEGVMYTLPVTSFHHLGKEPDAADDDAPAPAHGEHEGGGD